MGGIDGGERKSGNACVATSLPMRPRPSSTRSRGASSSRCHRALHRHAFVVSAILLMIVAWSADAIAAQLTLTWADASTDEHGFSIERGPDATGPFSHIATTGAGVTSYVDTELAEATHYCYRVQAFNAEGASGYSNTACATTARMYGLAVVKIGAGSGTVTSAPAGIACGASCSSAFANGTAVTLTANTAAGSTFTGWGGGGCSGSGGCTVAVTAATTITATFAPSSSVLTTSVSDDFRRPDATVLGHGWTVPSGSFFIRDGRLW